MAVSFSGIAYVVGWLKVGKLVGSTVAAGNDMVNGPVEPWALRRVEVDRYLRCFTRFYGALVRPKSVGPYKLLPRARAIEWAWVVH